VKPAAGLILGGRYRLRGRLAVGGMGEVWVAHDDSLARDVAVKVLREEFAGDPGFLDRFRTEARNCAQLSHPNIAQLFDYGEQQGSSFLVMELIHGEPLSELLAREPILPLYRLLPILAQTARGLHAAHAAGVVHRDVKPGNLLLSREGRVKITDFGVSLATNQVPMTAAGMVMGTAQYLSPEQAVGRPATPASDIYSLGIIAYEAIQGHRPFTGATAVDIAIAHVKEEVPPITEPVPPELDALIMRMLAKEPANRPRSAASLARVLDGMVDGTPPEGTPTADARGGGAEVEGRAADAEESASQDEPANPEESASQDEPANPEESASPEQAADGGELPDGRRPQHGPEAAVPPSYPPRRELRGARHVERDAPTARPTGHRFAPRRTSTTTGLRFGQLTTPMIALALLVVFALLGAFVASRLHNRTSQPEPSSTSSQIQLDGRESPEHPRRDGMIRPIVAAHELLATRSSTTKDT